MAEDSQALPNGAQELHDTEAPAQDSAPATDFEASLDADINPPNEDSTQAMNLDGANDAAGDASSKSLPTIETRIPAKKDASLREFLSQMDDYAPIVRYSTLTHL